MALGLDKMVQRVSLLASCVLEMDMMPVRIRVHRISNAGSEKDFSSGVAVRQSQGI